MTSTAAEEQTDQVLDTFKFLVVEVAAVVGVADVVNLDDGQVHGRSLVCRRQWPATSDKGICLFNEALNTIY